MPTEEEFFRGLVDGKGQISGIWPAREANAMLDKLLQDEITVMNVAGCRDGIYRASNVKVSSGGWIGREFVEVQADVWWLRPLPEEADG